MQASEQIMQEGIKCLQEHLGIVEAQAFIAEINHRRFDYTEWRRDNLFEDMTLEELVNAAAEHGRLHPFAPTKRMLEKQQEEQTKTAADKT